MSKPHFSIILPTYKRLDSVQKAIESVLNQTYTNWQLILVIDDNISNYSPIEKLVENNDKIIILKNSQNIGKNASLNRAINLLKENGYSGYITFLDDDDWLASDCLETFGKVIEENPTQNWFVSQRVNSLTNESFTINNTGRDIIRYQSDMLIHRTFTGDATHCINFKLTKTIFFPISIKNAEEWLYFAQLSTTQKDFRYLPVAGTYSEGYATDGLTFNYHNRHERVKNNWSIIKEIWSRKLFSPYILVYIAGRLLKSLK